MRPDEEPTPEQAPKPEADFGAAARALPVTTPPSPQPIEPQPPVVEPPSELPSEPQPEPNPEPPAEPASAPPTYAAGPQEPLELNSPLAPLQSEPPRSSEPRAQAPQLTEQRFDQSVFGARDDAPPTEAVHDLEHPSYPSPDPQNDADAAPYQTQAPAYEDAPVYEHDPRYAAFSAGEAEPQIPLPGEGFGDLRRARAAQANLDLDLSRIKRRKRYGLFLTTIGVLFVALLVAPVTWVLVYLFFDPPANVLMLQRAAEGQSLRHTPVPITRMSPYIIRSVIASEDSNFCTHHGFDVAAIQNAMESNADGGRMRGGSTISQQTAKNLFLWPQRSWVRKGFETYFTALIEFAWPKRRIMEAYLNAAEWGDGIFGVEAAAQARFGVSAADLTPLQAARLAAVLPSPNRWSVTSPGPYVRGRAASIVARAQVVRNQHMSGCVLSIDAATQ